MILVKHDIVGLQMTEKTRSDAVAESLPYTSHRPTAARVRVQTALRPIIPELFPILVRPYYSIIPE